MIIGIDIGGTFTDCLVLDDQGNLHNFKVPSTPQVPSQAVINSLEKSARFFGRSLTELAGGVGLLIHGTTLATNALLTGRGAKTGLVTTKGFRDIVEIRRGLKVIGGRSMYDMFLPPYKPLVPRYLRFGVEERTYETGEIVKPLNRVEVLKAIEKLKGEGVEAVAICFLHSYANPINEKEAAEIFREEFEGAYLAVSHEILPVLREYERFSTTVVSAYVGPITIRYLKELESTLQEKGFRGRLLIIQADGLVQTVAEVQNKAVYLVDSGPAAAPTAAIFHGAIAGSKNLISIDMGGTSFDICLIHDGQVATTTEMWEGDDRIAIKMREVTTAGAGGGSIAWIDSLGLLRVGPQSAGAEPGPACYGKRGEEPTVTDADLVLGYIPADYFLGGELPLDTGLAEGAVRKVADPLGMSVTEAAKSIFTTVNSFMADNITEVTTKRGHDVRDFTLVAGGGAGPVHGGYMAKQLGIDTVIIPRQAALYSAFGMLAMDIGRHYSCSYISLNDRIDIDRVNRLYEEMEGEAFRAFTDIDIPEKDVIFQRTAEMRYLGQFHEVEVEIPLHSLKAQDLGEILSRFHQRHTELYTFAMPERRVEFLTFHLLATARREPLSLREFAPAGEEPSAALKRRRLCLFPEEKEYRDTPVYDGAKLAPGNIIRGPAIVEEETTTVLIPEGFKCSVDRYKDYLLGRVT